MQSLNHTPLKAIFGGTFDPPHLGHLKPLLSVLDALNIDSCELIPSHIPVHKLACSSPVHRLNMTRLLAKQDPRLRVNDIEILRDKPSYSADTISALKHQNPEQAICFIMGFDAFLGLPTWFAPEQIMSQCNIIVMMRSEHQSSRINKLANELTSFLEAQHKNRFSADVLPSLSAPLQGLLPKHLYLVDKITQNTQNEHINGILRASKQGEVVFVLNKQTHISSTMIRRAISDGISVEQWLTPDIATYIRTHRIYNE